jgi:hypothetical protein
MTENTERGLTVPPTYFTVLAGEAEQLSRDIDLCVFPQSLSDLLSCCSIQKMENAIHVLLRVH